MLADIGDQQSIQESLSSFSAHIAHVRDMLERVTPESLVLLDELGRATDPEEGGALGVAILESFRAHGRVYAGVHASAGDEGVRSDHRGRAECVHGIRRANAGADLCAAPGRAGQIGRPGDRRASGASGI